MPWVNASYVYASNENAACLLAQVTVSDTRPWVGGTFVWTLHDYYGEPGRHNQWPHVSSSFGSFDLAGFSKAPAWWFRSWWLAAVPPADAGRPPLQHTAVTCHLAESWRPSPNGTRTLNVYTNAPYARILVNGIQPAGGGPTAVSAHGSAVFRGIGYEAGNVTAEALAANLDTDTTDGAAIMTTPLASHTKFSWGKPAAIVLSLDAPSASTGTGTAVYLDGEDVALLRATVVDASGVVVHDAVLNITFGVLEGPARVAGVGNGDPGDRTPNHASSKACYHGLARAIFKVTIKATGSAESRALEALVNPEAGMGPRSSSILLSEEDINTLPNSFTVTASAEGLATATLQVPLSTNDSDSVLSVAAASVSLADVGAM